MKISVHLTGLHRRRLSTLSKIRVFLLLSSEFTAASQGQPFSARVWALDSSVRLPESWACSLIFSNPEGYKNNLPVSHLGSLCESNKNYP